MFDSFCIPMGVPDNPTEPIPLKVIDTISEYLDIPSEKVTAKERGKDEVTFARHLSMYVLRQRTTLSVAKIGSYFSNRNYWTVAHAVRTINDYIDTNHPRAKLIDKLLHYAY